MIDYKSLIIFYIKRLVWKKSVLFIFIICLLSIFGVNQLFDWVYPKIENALKMNQVELNKLGVMITIVNFFPVLLSIIFTQISVKEDYHTDSVGTFLAKGLSRPKYLLSKFLSSLVVLITFYLLLVLWTVLLQVFSSHPMEIGLPFISSILVMLTAIFAAVALANILTHYLSSWISIITSFIVIGISASYNKVIENSASLFWKGVVSLFRWGFPPVSSLEGLSFSAYMEKLSYSDFALSFCHALAIILLQFYFLYLYFKRRDF